MFSNFFLLCCTPSFRYVANWVCVKHDPHWGRIVEKQLSNQTFRYTLQQAGVDFIPIMNFFTYFQI